MTAPQEAAGHATPEAADRQGEPVVIRGDGLVLREWTDADLQRMTELFDDEAVARWTPLESPFDPDSARRYLAKARDTRSSGRGIQLAITADGHDPLGEVLLFGTGSARSDPERAAGEIGYSVGAAHRGQGLAGRAVVLLADFATARWGLRRFLLQIPADNLASRRAAAAAGAVLTDAPPVVRAGRGEQVELDTWELRR